MWYLYLNREQQYLRSYRTHNLWLDSYNKKMRAPKINSFHVAVLRRLSKTVSGVSLHLQSASFQESELLRDRSSEKSRVT